MALFALPEEQTTRAGASTRGSKTAELRIERNLVLLLVTVFLSGTGVYIGRLGMSLSMKTLHFGPSALTSTAVVGGLLTMPAALGLATLADRLGRKRFLLIAYLLALIGALLLNNATHLWQFWLATVLLLIATSANSAVIPALAGDLLPLAQLSRALPWLNAMAWMGGIFGFAGAGYLLEVWGALVLYGCALILIFSAILVLAQLPTGEVAGKSNPAVSNGNALPGSQLA